MQHYWSLESANLTNTWLTIGSFDGVHHGHQKIVERLTNGAKKHNANSVVLTFFPHPAVVLGKRKYPFYLTSPSEKAELLFSYGVDFVITHPFSKEIAGISAREFMNLVSEHTGLRNLVVGYDFALGHRREGDLPYLKKLGEELGYSIHSVKPYKNGNVIVSSSHIRDCLLEGDVEQAAAFLGRPFSINGKVIHGDGRGKLIGIPTANLEIWPEKAIPKTGVYACKAIFESEIYTAVTNIGYRPTFEGGNEDARVETHMIGFAKDIYGSEINLEFITRLRDEMRFPSIEALVSQIKDDIKAARQLKLE